MFYNNILIKGVIMNLADYAKPFSYETNSKIGVLVIHGFTSTTSSVLYLGEQLRDAGFNVELPSLSGHGTTWQDLNRVKYQDWINDVEEALNKLKKRASKIFVAGLSMGGPLALYLAQNHPELLGIILINHALFLKRDWRLPLLPIMRFIIPYDKDPVGGDIKDPKSKEMVYDKATGTDTLKYILLFGDGSYINKGDVKLNVDSLYNQ